MLVRCCATHRPSAVLTTSSVAGNIAEYVESKPGESAPSVIEVDLLDLDSKKGPAAGTIVQQSTAYLQYTSGSTRPPAGVMVSHNNIMANFEQIMSDYFGDHGEVAPPDTTIVSWLPFYHDMGLYHGNYHSDSDGISRCAHEPGVVPAAAGPVDAIAGKQQSRIFGSTELRFRIGGTKNIR